MCSEQRADGRVPSAVFRVACVRVCMYVCVCAASAMCVQFSVCAACVSPALPAMVHVLQGRANNV
jgi:hypothetical protein